MRYSITINQLAIINNNLDLSLEEVVVLDYLYWLCGSKNQKLKRISDDLGIYTWFDYGYFLKQNPLLQNKWKSKASLAVKLKILEEKGFIKTKLSGDYIQRKYIMILPKIELMYGDDETKEKNRKIIKNEKCEWCDNDELQPLEEHHFPISRKDGGKKVVRICMLCHKTYHDTDKELSPTNRKDITVQNSKQYTVQKEKQYPFRKLNEDNINIDPCINNKKEKTFYSLKDFKEMPETKIKEIADKYKISVSCVKNRIEDVIDYCEAKGKKYSNYEAALRNFIKTHIRKYPDEIIVPAWKPTEFKLSKEDQLKRSQILKRMAMPKVNNEEY